MISYFFEDTDFILSHSTTVSNWLNNVAISEGSCVQSLSYIFCSDPYLLSINNRFLEHDFYTDVITFDQRDHIDSCIEGDIFVSVDRVYENASSFSNSFDEELRRVMVHGMLHLLGYEDGSDESKFKMRSLEDHYLSQYPIGIS